MPDAETHDHDQRLKVLLKTFFEQFFLCFFPGWAACIDFSNVTWHDKEVFLAPPQGEKRILDLVAKVHLRPEVPSPVPGQEELLAVVHIEIESQDSISAFRPRMFEYYTQVRRDYGLAVLPIGLFLRVGLDGIGWDDYEEYFRDKRVLHFSYAYVGLPALNSEDYVTGEHLLGVALSALMRAPKDRQVKLHAESLKRIARSSNNDIERFLLTECREAYVSLDEEQRQDLAKLIETEDYREAKPLMITTYERGIQQGKIEGEILGEKKGRIHALRETAVGQLDARFGPLPAAIEQRVSDLTLDQLRQLLIDIVKAETIEGLSVLKAN